jgi:hypothetical protein
LPASYPTAHPRTADATTSRNPSPLALQLRDQTRLLNHNPPQHSQLSQHIHKGHALGQLGNRHPKIITDPPPDADAGSSQLNSYPRACRCVFDLAVNNE